MNTLIPSVFARVSGHRLFVENTFVCKYDRYLAWNANQNKPMTIAMSAKCQQNMLDISGIALWWLWWLWSPLIACAAKGGYNTKLIWEWNQNQRPNDKTADLEMSFLEKPDLIDWHFTDSINYDWTALIIPNVHSDIRTLITVVLKLFTIMSSFTIIHSV